MDREVVKLEVAFVNFKPQMGLKTSVEVEEVIEMNEEELNKREAQFNSDKYLIGPPAFNHFIWYSNAIRLELGSIGPSRKLQVTHLRVESGIKSGFVMKNIFYHSLTIIVGPIEEHFHFVDAHGSARCGRRFRPHLEALARSRVLERIPSSYQKCPEDFCANNCHKCRSSSIRDFCLCNGKAFPSAKSQEFS